MVEDDVVRRLRQVEDRLAIGELLANYCYALDRGLEDMFRGLWVADGVWEFQAPLGRHEGIDRIMAMWRDIRTQTTNVHHLTADVCVVELTDDEARVRSDGLAQATAQDAAAAETMFVHFDDVLRRVGGQWRFASRFVHFYGQALMETGSG